MTYHQVYGEYGTPVHKSLLEFLKNRKYFKYTHLQETQPYKYMILLQITQGYINIIKACPQVCFTEYVISRTGSH